MEAFGIIGYSFGLMGFIFGLVAFTKLNRLSKALVEKKILEPDWEQNPTKKP